MRNLLLISLFWEHFINPLVRGFSNQFNLHKQLKKEEPEIYSRAIRSFYVELILLIILITILSCLS